MTKTIISGRLFLSPLAALVCGLYVGKTLWKPYDIFNLILAVFWAGYSLMWIYLVRREFNRISNFTS
jgi:hypothetical protein